MCHFCEEVWNFPAGFHTTVRCTVGAVSRGRRGRCFFTVAGAAAAAGEEPAVVAVLGSRLDVGVAAKETTLRGMVIGDRVGSFTQGAEEDVSPEGGGAALQVERGLPAKYITTTLDDIQKQQYTK